MTSRPTPYATASAYERRQAEKAAATRRQQEQPQQEQQDAHLDTAAEAASAAHDAAYQAAADASAAYRAAYDRYHDHPTPENARTMHAAQAANEAAQKAEGAAADALAAYYADLEAQAEREDADEADEDAADAIRTALIESGTIDPEDDDAIDRLEAQVDATLARRRRLHPALEAAYRTIARQAADPTIHTPHGPDDDCQFCTARGHYPEAYDEADDELRPQITPEEQAARVFARHAYTAILSAADELARTDPATYNDLESSIILADNAAIDAAADVLGRLIPEPERTTRIRRAANAATYDSYARREDLADEYDYPHPYGGYAEGPEDDAYSGAAEHARAAYAHGIYKGLINP